LYESGTISSYIRLCTALRDFSILRLFLKYLLKILTMPHALNSRDSAMEFRPVGSYPSTGIDVLIVGTGLAGLTAAIECVRKGHNVKVLERNATMNTAGRDD
jgi:NADPH-dependent 2,4-dienoyl-CoA reductase/sulfur reductase-like enzyme